MKTMNEKTDKKLLWQVTIGGYLLIAVFAILRVLTDLSEWSKKGHTAG